MNVAQTAVWVRMRGDPAVLNVFVPIRNPVLNLSPRGSETRMRLMLHQQLTRQHLEASFTSQATAMTYLGYVDKAPMPYKRRETDPSTIEQDHIRVSQASQNV